MGELMVISEKGKLMELSVMEGNLAGKSHGFVEVEGMKSYSERNGKITILCVRVSSR